jgi:hypothetical protein
MARNAGLSSVVSAVQALEALHHLEVTPSANATPVASPIDSPVTVEEEFDPKIYSEETGALRSAVAACKRRSSARRHLRAAGPAGIV